LARRVRKGKEEEEKEDEEEWGMGRALEQALAEGRSVREVGEEAEAGTATWEPKKRGAAREEKIIGGRAFGLYSGAGNTWRFSLLE